jgi:hypothetical protein
MAASLQRAHDNTTMADPTGLLYSMIEDTYPYQYWRRVVPADFIYFMMQFFCPLEGAK